MVEDFKVAERDILPSIKTHSELLERAIRERDKERTEFFSRMLDSDIKVLRDFLKLKREVI